MVMTCNTAMHSALNERWLKWDANSYRQSAIAETNTTGKSMLATLPGCLTGLNISNGKGEAND